VLVDVARLPDPAVIDVDICIIGAGAAGITLARELAGSRARVCLLEAGGLNSDRGAQALMRAESVGRRCFPLELVRISGFGGTTSIWAGACRPLDPIDFSVREWVAESGWPITREQLDPLYARAHMVCQLGPYTYAPRDWERAREHRFNMQPGTIDTHIFQLSTTRFGAAYRRAILEAKNILTCLGMHAVKIDSDDLGRTATHVVARSLHGKEVRVGARVFVLAAGGIENPRLLLLSRDHATTGLGNQQDLVGRFFMDHLYLDSGELEFAQAAHRSRLYSIHYANGSKVEAVLSIGDDIQRREGLVRCAFLFPPRWRTGAAYYSPAMTSLLYFIRLVRLGRLPYGWQTHAWAMLAGLDDVLRTTQRRLVNWASPANREMVRAFGEQTPNYASRVTLSDETDSLGRNLARIDWRVNESDFESMRQSHAVLAAEVERAGLGRLNVRSAFDDQRWSSRVTGGYHHMGTTRMHADPCHGVVDVDCRVHGMTNLYIAGSSVFPTGGYANPTLTIVALAMRLADHLKARFV
jgi:choline dehydrogenase-like flavoprotein